MVGTIIWDGNHGWRMSLVRVEWGQNILSWATPSLQGHQRFWNQRHQWHGWAGVMQTQKGDRDENPLSWACNGCNSQLFVWTNGVKECKKNADRWNADNQASAARLIQIKRARERWLVPNARTRVGFADGSLKVLEKFCGQNLTTKSADKIWPQKRATNA